MELLNFPESAKDLTTPLNHSSPFSSLDRASESLISVASENALYPLWPEPQGSSQERLAFSQLPGKETPAQARETLDKSTLSGLPFTGTSSTTAAFLKARALEPLRSKM